MVRGLLRRNPKIKKPHAQSVNQGVHLITLDDFMATCRHDISKFNGKVTDLLDLLKAREETKIDHIINIFRGYNACSDKVCVK